MTTPTGTQTVERAARLLAEIVEADEAVTFSVLARRTGLARSTTSRLLVSLEHANLIRREDGAYRPGDLFVHYAWRSGGESGLARLARPVMERLGATTGETVNLGVARESGVEQLAQVDSRFLLGATNWVGRVVPLHASALGKVLLAFGAARLGTGRLLRCTPRTVTNRSALSLELDEVRRRGYAVTDGELEHGLVACAAPVFGRSTAAVAALSVSAPSSRTGRGWGAAIEACVAGADELSGLLGHGTRKDGAA